MARARPPVATSRKPAGNTKDLMAMHKLTGAILMLAAAVSGHAVFVFLASHPHIHKYDIPPAVTNMVFVAIAATTLLGLWGVYHLLKKELL